MSLYKQIKIVFKKNKNCFLKNQNTLHMSEGKYYFVKKIIIISNVYNVCLTVGYSQSVQTSGLEE